MKNLGLIFLLTLLIFSQQALAVNDNPTPPNYEKASFPGGQDALVKHIENNLIYPTEAREQAIEGEVIVSFTVKSDGSLAAVRIQQGITQVCDEEVLRLINKMPAWEPAQYLGRNAPSKVALRINFALTD